MLVSAIAVAVLIALLSCICVVPDGCEFATFIGGGYHRTLKKGVHFKVPLVERVVKKVWPGQQSIAIIMAPIITKDNMTVEVHASVSCSVSDTKTFVCNVNDFDRQVTHIVITAMRKLIDEIETKDIRGSASRIVSESESMSHVELEELGLKLCEVKLFGIDLPPGF